MSALGLLLFACEIDDRVPSTLPDATGGQGGNDAASEIARLDGAPSTASAGSRSENSGAASGGSQQAGGSVSTEGAPDVKSSIDAPTGPGDAGDACATGTCPPPPVSYQLTVSSTGVDGASGVVSSVPIAGVDIIDCGAGCSTRVPPSTRVTLNATPAAGYYFSSWTGGCADNLTSQCIVTVTTDTTVAAVFAPANKMFVSSSVNTISALGGVAGADAECTRLAASARLSGTFRAYLDDHSGSFDQRFTGRGGAARGWVRVDGTPFLDERQSGSIYYSPDMDETGRRLNTLTPYVMTSVSAPCTTVDIGTPTGGGTGWSFYGTDTCASALHLYCLQIDYRATLTFAKSLGWVGFVSDPAQGRFDPSAGLQGADALCDRQAASANLSGQYRAMLATTTASIASRFSSIPANQPIVRPDGVLLAARVSGLFAAGSRLESAFAVTAAGAATDRYVATGNEDPGGDPNALGTPDSTCNNWTSASSSMLATMGSPRHSNFLQNSLWEIVESCDPTSLVDTVYCLQFAP